MTTTPISAAFSFPAALDSIRPATETLLETARGWGVGPAFGGLFEIALAEVIVNAVKHGGQRPDGEIRCEIELAAGALVVRVFDAGAGFDPAAVLAPSPAREEPASLAESGYGLAIVRSQFTRVEPVWRGTVFGLELARDLDSQESVS